MSVILLAILSTAGGQCLSVDQTRCIPPPKLCTVQVPCSPVKPKPKPVPKPPKVEKEPCCKTENITQIKTENVTNNTTNNYSTVNVTNTYLVHPKVPVKYQQPAVQLGLRGAGGAWLCPDHGFGLVGLRVKFPDLYLGLELNTSFTNKYNMGHQAQVLLYLTQGKVNWHLDLGAMSTGDRYFSNKTVPRTWDLTLGTGLEVPVSKEVSFTADLRTTMPNPGTMGALALYGKNGVYLNSENALGNALLASQLQLGVMLHTW
jgi:hypothetical protein